VLLVNLTLLLTPTDYISTKTILYIVVTFNDIHKTSLILYILLFYYIIKLLLPYSLTHYIELCYFILNLFDVNDLDYLTL